MCPTHLGQLRHQCETMPSDRRWEVQVQTVEEPRAAGRTHSSLLLISQRYTPQPLQDLHLCTDVIGFCLHFLFIATQALCGEQRQVSRLCCELLWWLFVEQAPRGVQAQCCNTQNPACPTAACLPRPGSGPVLPMQAFCADPWSLALAGCWRRQRVSPANTEILAGRWLRLARGEDRGKYHRRMALVLCCKPDNAH